MAGQSLIILGGKSMHARVGRKNCGGTSKSQTFGRLFGSHFGSNILKTSNTHSTNLNVGEVQFSGHRSEPRNARGSSRPLSAKCWDQQQLAAAKEPPPNDAIPQQHAAVSSYLGSRPGWHRHLQLRRGRFLWRTHGNKRHDSLKNNR